MPLNTILLSLCSKVDFIWTCAVQLVITQSLQFSQISKKPAREFRQFFSYRQESLFLFNLEKKWVHRARYCGSIAEVHLTCKFISNNVHARWKLKFTCKYQGSKTVKMELNWRFQWFRTGSLSTMESFIPCLWGTQVTIPSDQSPFTKGLFQTSCYCPAKLARL